MTAEAESPVAEMHAVYAGAIDDQPSFDSDSLAGAKSYVRAALDEAMAGKAVTVASTKAYGCSVKY